MERKVAFVTGGASGLGFAISKFLASKNCDIIIHYYTSLEKAKMLKKEIEDCYHVNVLLVCGDISNEEDIKKMIEKIKSEFSHVDYLVNNAAICIDSLFYDKTKDNFMHTLDVNVVGSFLISKYIGDIMYQNKKGSIVNISSTNGIHKYFPMSVDYDASKAALNSLTHNLTLQFSPYVRVNAVAPGWIKTENEMKDLDNDYINQEEEKIFIKRFAEEEEIAKIIYFLLSDDSSYINNQIIIADGGTY